MVNISATVNGDMMDMHIECKGKNGDIVDEAVAIMTSLPKELEKFDKTLFLMFLAKLSMDEHFGVDLTSIDDEEEDEYEQ